MRALLRLDRVLVLLGAIASTSFASMASAVILDFESWSHDDDLDTIQSSSYYQDGFTIYVSAAPPEAWRTYGLQHPSFAGSTAIHSTNPTHQNYLYARDELIDVRSVKIARGRFTNFASGSVRFYARFEDSSSITHTCSFSGLGTTLETCTFPPTFTGIQTLFWYNSNPICQLDDFDVSITTPPVPTLGPLSQGVLAAMLASAGLLMLLRIRVLRTQQVSSRGPDDRVQA